MAMPSILCARPGPPQVGRIALVEARAGERPFFPGGTHMDDTVRLTDRPVRQHAEIAERLLGPDSETVGPSERPALARRRRVIGGQEKIVAGSNPCRRRVDLGPAVQVGEVAIRPPSVPEPAFQEQQGGRAFGGQGNQTGLGDIRDPSQCPAGLIAIRHDEFGIPDLRRVADNPLAQVPGRLFASMGAWGTLRDISSGAKVGGNGGVATAAIPGSDAEAADRRFERAGGIPDGNRLLARHTDGSVAGDGENAGLTVGAGGIADRQTRDPPTGGCRFHIRRGREESGGETPGRVLQGQHPQRALGRRDRGTGFFQFAACPQQARPSVVALEDDDDPFLAIGNADADRPPGSGGGRSVASQRIRALRRSEFARRTPCRNRLSDRRGCGDRTSWSGAGPVNPARSGLR